jgi:hypothetical protein
MKLYCDPPRHAFQIQFSAPPATDSYERLSFRCERALVEIDLIRSTSQPILAAIHFVRHGFWLPFIDPAKKFSTEIFHLSQRLNGNEYSFFLDPWHTGCKKWEPLPGLKILTSQPPYAEVQGSTRPVLYGIEVDTRMLRVNINNDDFEFVFGADSLK